MSSSDSSAQIQIMSEETTLISGKGMGCGGQDCTPYNVIRSAFCVLGSVAAGAVVGGGVGWGLTQAGVPSLIAATPTECAIGGGFAGLGCSTSYYFFKAAPTESRSPAEGSPSVSNQPSP